MDAITSLTPFKAIDANPGRTMKCLILNEYFAQLELLFKLAFRKADTAQYSNGTAYAPPEAEKKAMAILKGGKDMRTLFKHVSTVQPADTFEQAIQKIKEKLSGGTNKTIQRNMLLCSNPQGGK